ncbi:hypothetical protein MMC17_004801 [Xylographa soralifera]|nr:hypothetical protein [Xylographa soralifera]
MAIFASTTAGPVICLNGSAHLTPSVLKVIAAVLDHMQDLPVNPKPELVENPVRDTYSDAVSSFLTGRPYEVLCSRFLVPNQDLKDN